MQCPLCKTELRILKSRHVLENDDTPEQNTKLFIEMDMGCMNKECSNYKTVLETARNELPIG